MAYTKTKWEDRRTIVNATRLNNMEDGIESAHLDISQIQADINQMTGGNQALSQLVNEIRNDRGYVNTKILSDGTDFDTLVLNGKFRIYQGVNAPLTGNYMFVIDVTADGQNISQIASLVNGDSNLYRRNCVNGTWSSWERLVTETELTNTNQSLNQAITDIGNLDTRVTTNEADIITIKGDITQNQTDIASLDGRVTTNEADIVTIKNDIANMGNDITSLGQDVSDIQNAIGLGSSTGGDSLSDRITANADAITDLESRVDTNEFDIDDLKDEDTRINERLDLLEEKVTTNTDDLRDDLQANIDKVEADALKNFTNVSLKINGLSTDLTSHFTDPQAHLDIRTQIGDVGNLLTSSKEVVSAINEIYLTGGSGSGGSDNIIPTLKNDKLIRVFAQSVTDTFDVGVPLENSVVEVYLMGLRLFKDKDYTLQDTYVILSSTLLVGEYIDILIKQEVIIDFAESTFKETHVRYVANQDTSSIVIPEDISYGTLEIYQEGVRLYENYDYTLDRDTQTLTLVQDLAENEYIDYTIRVNTGLNVSDIYDGVDAITGIKDDLDDILALKDKVEANEQNIEAVQKNVDKLKDYVSNLSNPNLLINGDFQVWQRGDEFVNTATTPTFQYTADRWITTSGFSYGSIIRKLDGIRGMKIINENPLSSLNVSQPIENLPKGTYTLSAQVNGDIYSLTVAEKSSINTDPVSVPLGADGRLVFGRNFQTFEGNAYVSIEVSNTCSVNIDWVKLEAGTVATPISPRKYAEELRDCQRYYEILSEFSCPCLALSESKCNINFAYSEKRSRPISIKVLSLNGNTALNCYGKDVVTINGVASFETVRSNSRTGVAIIGGTYQVIEGLTYHMENDIEVDAEIYL